MTLAGRRTVMGLAVRAALVPAGALAVHQLRFVLAYGGAAGAELAETGHSYLHSLVPWIVLLIGLAAGGFLWALGRAFSAPRSISRHSASFPALWLACVACLVAIYGIQEFLEGLFATGHPAGLLADAPAPQLDGVWLPPAWRLPSLAARR